MFLLYLSRMIGICHLRYVPESARFARDTGPMLIYWIMLSLIYLVLTPYMTIVLLWSFFQCQQMDMLAIAYSVVSLPKVLLILLLICSSWLLARRWQRVANEFLALRQEYFRDSMESGYRYWLRHVAKMILILSRIMLVVNLFFGPASLLMCAGISKKAQEMSSVYIFLSVSLLPMDMMTCFADYSLYRALGLSNWLLNCMAKEAQDLRQDMRYLPRRQGCHRAVYQDQLLTGWRQLWRRCMRLDKLGVELLSVYKWHIALNLFANYLIDITNIFSLIIYANEPLVLWNYICGCVLCILFHLDIMTYFACFEVNHLRWKHLLQCVHKTWLTLGKMELDRQADTHCVALYRLLEFGIFCLNRKLQRHPRRIRNLHIFGLFDMNQKSAFSLTTSMATNVIILCQIAYKNYY